jgi:hypothetical protein
MTREKYEWPDTEAPLQKPLTPQELSEHRRAILTLFGGSIIGYILFAYLVGAPPLRIAVVKTWLGIIALMQGLW